MDDWQTYGSAKTCITYHFIELTEDKKIKSIADIYLPGYSGCVHLMEVTKDDKFYYDCTEGDGTARHDYFYQIDSNHQSGQLLMQCDEDTGEASSSCH